MFPGVHTNTVAEPYQPHNLKKGDHTTTSANISRKSGCNGGAAQTFHIEYKKTETRNIIWTLGPSVPQLSDSDNEEYNSEITDLDPDTHYHVRIKASNIIGQNTSDSIEVRTLKTGKLDVVSISPVTGPVVGAVLAFLVISVIVLLVLWRRGILPNHPCLKRKKEPESVYQNQAFSPESEHSRSETVYQDLGPTENDSLHYEPLEYVSADAPNVDALPYRIQHKIDAEHQDSDSLYVNT
ncbi:hypothetical protein ScPMuIL_000905 [Solemya velum]